MENKEEYKYLELVKKFLDIAHPLATGPNKYKSRFGGILEGVFRKDYFTLQTMVTLTNLIVADEGFKVSFAGSILDLSRRVLEDMIYMAYIKERGSEKYSKQFIQYAVVEQKRDVDFLKIAGVKVDEERRQEIEEEYAKIPKKLKERNNWAGQSVEQVILWLVANNKIKESEKDTILGIYVLGNRRNHTSSGDILGHTRSESLLGEARLDIDAGLMITYGAALKVALYLIEEIEVTEEMAKSINDLWDEVIKISK
jgi:hypothetical protein